MKWFVVVLVILVLLLVGVYLVLNPEKYDLDDSERARLGGTYLQLSDGVTHYRLDGPAGGRVVVLVHGGTVPIWTWDRQVPALIDAGFRVLTYDKYGRGYSDRPEVTYDQELYRRQLLELADRLSLTEPFDLVGLSLGGGTVINFTAHHPERVCSLILIAPLIDNFKVSTLMRTPVLGEFMARTVGIRVMTERFVSLFDQVENADRYTSLFIEQTTYRGFQRSVLSMLRSDAVGDYRDAYRRVGDQDRETLLIWGTEDTEVAREMIEEVRESLPRLRFEPIEGTGHGVVFQRPQRVTDLILDFLQPHED
ncbi:MAG: alpha/beta hydrolase [Desulfomonilia bacterium]|nr:alpha/beta hydrolase [Desulfomonilia bacterium]